jgi:glycine/D-amino acid oxidase-like deaminating enzyme
VSKSSVIVIGAGAFGGWTALSLLRRGARVTLVDAWGPGNSRASSGGETRIIRATYGPSKIYTQMAADSLRLWKENEKRWPQPVFTGAGVLWMVPRDDAYEVKALAALEEAAIPFEKLTTDQAARRWPQFNFEGVNWSIHEPDAGFITARRACEFVLRSFLEEGGTYVQAHAAPALISARNMESVVLNGSERMTADQYVFACGPWLPDVFPALGPVMKITRQEVFFFGVTAGETRFSESAMPVWIDNAVPRFYGIPGNQWRGFKLASDARGPAFDPTHGERRISETALAAARSYLAMRFPRLKAAPVVESRVCQYENSVDEDFIMDRHPVADNVWIVGGGSGHGFKHGPAVGEMMAGAVLGTRTPPPEFALARFGTLDFE